MSNDWASIDLDRPRTLHGRSDTLAYLTVWIILLYGISARQVVPGTGAIGTPAMFLALLAFVAWAVGRLAPGMSLDHSPNPMRAGLVVYLSYEILSFAVANSRSLTPLESTGSTRALLTAFAMAGIALMALEGLSSQRQAVTLLRRFVIGGTYLAILGIAQFVTRLELHLSIPGLSWNQGPPGLSSRGPFVRPPANAQHAIEFSVVTAALLPLALHFVFYGASARQRQSAGVAAGTLALASLLSISRTSLLSLAAGLLVISLAWAWRRRVNALLTTVVAIPLVWALIPGLVGTFIGLFSGVDDDPSIQARIRRVPRIMAQIRERPMLGLGNGTWSSEEYFLVDNEIYVTTLEMGLVGIGLTISIVLLAIALATLMRQLPGVDEPTGHLAQAVAASVTALAISFATFDAFHYHILRGTLFLLLGTVGALWHLNRGSDELHRLTARSRSEFERRTS